MNNFQTAFTYDDLQMVPKKTKVKSRSDVDLLSNLDDNFKFELPVISSPMDTVTSIEMAMAMSENGGLGIIHRYNSIEEQVKLCIDPRTKYLNKPFVVAAAIGANNDYFERAQELVKNDVKILCIDTAHAHSEVVEQTMYKLKSHFNNDIHLMVGNVATGEAFKDLSDWGADSIRAGVGNGSICSTRLKTGFGIPSMSTLFDCMSYKKKYNLKTKIIMDGGMRDVGDICKSLAAGADFVILGSMLAGTDESPGQVIEDLEGNKRKVYRGMASTAAQMDWRGKSSAAEGISTTIPYKGSVHHILSEMKGNIQSSLSYNGSTNLQEFRDNVQFIVQTFAGMNEAHTHILYRNK